MSKTLFYRLFGFGKVPGRFRSVVEEEGVELIEEGISGSVTFRNFRAPGRRYGWRRNWFSGSLVLTKTRFWAFTTFQPVVSVAYADAQVADLHCALEGRYTLSIKFDVSRFHEGWSGDINCRFKTFRAGEFLQRLNKMAPRE